MTLNLNTVTPKDCHVAPLWILYVVQVLTFAMFALFARDARKRGTRWLAMLLWGVLFGLSVEWTLTCNAPGYEYDPHFWHLHSDSLHLRNIPVWVAVGWSLIIYAASWTAQRLNVPRFVQPIVAGYLAVNVDLSLDPIASRYGFWCWAPTPASFAGVPFHNFDLWVVVVAVYAGTVRWVLRLANRKANGVGWRDPLPAHARLPPAWVQALLPGVGVLISLCLFALVHFVGDKTPIAQGGAFAVGLFAAIGLFALILLFAYARSASRRGKRDVMTLSLPLTFHLFCYGMSFPLFGSDSALALLIPANTIVAFFAYAWPFLDSFVPPEALVPTKNEDPDDSHEARHPARRAMPVGP